MAERSTQAVPQYNSSFLEIEHLREMAIGRVYLYCNTFTELADKIVFSKESSDTIRIGMYLLLFILSTFKMLLKNLSDPVQLLNLFCFM